MKKVLFCVMALFVIAHVGYAADTQNVGAVTVTEEKTTTVKIDKTKQEPNVTEESGSVYDSVRSGWNKFIDLLVGPKK